MFGKSQETLATESWKGQRLSEEKVGGISDAFCVSKSKS